VLHPLLVVVCGAFSHTFVCFFNMRLSVPLLVFAVLVGGVKSQPAAANAAAPSPSPPASAPVGATNDEDENDSAPSQGNNSSSSSSSSAPANSTVAATPAAAPSNVDSDGTPSATYAPTPLIETETPTAAPFYAQRECYDKLQIVHDMIKVQEPFMQHVYKLCPNTIFDIGTMDENHECCIDGDARLVPRKDTTIQCGEDGLSTNNCTLRGGPVQVISWNENYNLEAKTSRD
jgi:hypothetical protein